MKLYTKRGDAGQTDSGNGQRLDKDAPLIEAYGALDELTVSLGFVCAACLEEQDMPIKHLLLDLQKTLLTLTSSLATNTSSQEEDKKDEELIKALEQTIDEYSQKQPRLKNFILPGGSEISARLHLARTTCRRAERRLVTLNKEQKVPNHLLAFINRLSDLLYTLAQAK